VKTDNFKKVLEEIRDQIIEDSKKNLAKQGKVGKLYESIEGSTVYETKDKIYFNIEMEDYGLFQDKGVKGADPSKQIVKDKYRKPQQAPNSPYKFGSGNMKGTFDDFAKSVGDWAKGKGFRLRDEKGRFVRGTYETIGKIIARNIYYRGLKPSLFLTNAFEKAQNDIGSRLEKALKLDTEIMIKITAEK
jgi:hypothetical protein